MVEERSYDAWGRLRNPDVWDDYQVSDLAITNRGYTFHEHLLDAGLINMNGRLYDPVLARMLSPDNYVQSAGNPQNYNRYSYVLNNPLKYTDPSGEVFLAAGIIAGALINTQIQMLSGKVDGIGDLALSLGVGAAAGAISGGLANAVGAGLGQATTLGAEIANGAVSTAVTGVTSGFVSGVGNSLIDGNGLGESLTFGARDAALGFASGAILGGIAGGAKYISKNRIILRAARKELAKEGIKSIRKLDKTDKFLKRVATTVFPDAPHSVPKSFTIENVPLDFRFRSGVSAETVLYNNGDISVYFNDKAFTHINKLIRNIGHEMLHVSQFNWMISNGVDNATMSFLEPVWELHAYFYESELLNTKFSKTQLVSHVFSNKSLLQHPLTPKLSYGNFSWTTNIQKFR